MAFTPRTFAEITKQMVNYFSGQTSTVTDFIPGSKIRTLLEAVAQALEGFYRDLVQATSEAVDTATYTTFGFKRQEAQKAYGRLRLTANTPPGNDIIIAQGKKFRVPGTTKTYQTIAQFVLLAGQSYVDVDVEALTAGAAGNTPASSITEFVEPIPGIDSVTNQQPFTTGADKETDEERRARFSAFIASVHRADEAALEYGAKSAKLLDAWGQVTEVVMRAQVVDAGAAQVSIGVHNGRTRADQGTATSASLVTEAQKLINGYVDAAGKKVPGYKAAGVTATVSAALEQQVTVTATVTPQAGFTIAMVKTAIQNAILELFRQLEVGETLKLSALIAAAKGVRGVQDVAFSSPTGNTDPPDGTVLILSTLPTIS